MSTSSSRFGNDSLQIVDLSLRTAESTKSLLGQLSRSLVLAVSQQFDNTALIRSQASDFLDDLANESSALAKQALSAGDAWLGGDGCDLL